MLAVRMNLVWGALCAVALGAAGCPARVKPGPRDTGLVGLALSKVAPQTLLRGSHVYLTGRSFVDAELGEPELVLAGTIDGDAVEVRRSVKYVTSSELGLEIDSDFLDEIGGLQQQRDFKGTARIEYVSTVDGQRYRSGDLQLALAFQPSLTPDVFAVGDGVVFVNQPILVDGNRFLLGTNEGTTEAVLTGCFQPSTSGTCAPVAAKRLPVSPLDLVDRTRGAFVYSSQVSGIGPGTFTGEVHFENTHQDGNVTTSDTIDIELDVQPPALGGASTTSASLGQYVVLTGGGFVGNSAEESTTLELKGVFTPDAEGEPVNLDLVLVPEFRSGLELRYVLDDRDALGEVIDLRKTTGTITGTVQIVVEQRGTIVKSAITPVLLSILPVKQVVHIRFVEEYVNALRRFGLRAADPLVQARVLAVAARDYQGVNIEFRTMQPDDFALYSEVDISGVDPSGGHSFGFDNTPGKDTGNERLYDRIGGVNAVTQQNDGVAGYGGVFMDSFFLFSTRPPDPLYENIRKSDLWQQMRIDLFDELFDPFRSDRGGAELTASELDALDPPVLTEGSGCPAAKNDRRMQAACAIFALGNLIGGTMTHEIGHSLGLADPYGPAFHDPGDQPNRLMDSGGNKSFNERVELKGEGPSRFCDDGYVYLREILPSPAPAPDVTRPTCF